MDGFRDWQQFGCFFFKSFHFFQVPNHQSLRACAGWWFEGRCVGCFFRQIKSQVATIEPSNGPRPFGLAKLSSFSLKVRKLLIEMVPSCENLISGLELWCKTQQIIHIRNVCF